MNAKGNGGRQTGLHAMWLVPALGILFLGAAAAGSGDRITLRPRLQNGAKVDYEMRGRLERDVKTKSNVATMMSPRGLRRDLSIGLRLTVQEIREVDGRLMMAAETEMIPVEAGTGGAPPRHTKVNFTIGGSGDVTRADGLDDLPDEERLAWQSWISQFAFGWTLPPTGVKPGEKWKSEDVEKTPAPIAGLVWERETTYVENGKCPIVPEEQCASFLTVSTLRQKSNPKDATPEDYRLRELKTSGTVSGKNQTVSYYSLKTGLLMRATEDVQQSMDVTIAKADGSNQVQYQIEAISHLETVLVHEPISPAN